MKNGEANPDVWAIGDASRIENAPLPAIAQGASSIHKGTSGLISAPQVANQEAKYLAKKMNKIVRDQESPVPFEFHNQDSLAYIGNW